MAVRTHLRRLTRPGELVDWAVRKAARRSGNEVVRAYPVPEAPLDVLDLCVRDHLHRRPADEFRLVQIGANDGATYDPVREVLTAYGMRGVLIEPHPVIFEQLTANYADMPGVTCLNLAIADTEGTLTFYGIRQDIPELPTHATQCCGFRRDLVEQMGESFIVSGGLGDRYKAADLVQEIPVPTRTMASVLEEQGIDHVDCLVIDTLGFDWRIIRTFPFDRWKPDILQFEHSYFTVQELEDCVALLEGHGYKVTKVFMDTIAYLHGRGHRLWD